MQNSTTSKLLPPKKYAALAIDFLIVGGGIAGLASAIALTRIGHRVTVLERDATVDHVRHSPSYSVDIDGTDNHRRRPGEAA